MREEIPYQKWYEGDFRGSPRVWKLEWLDRMVYRELLQVGFQFGDDGLPPIDELVSVLDPHRRKRATLRRRVDAALKAHFEERGGRWFHRRVERDVTFAMAERRRLSEAGRKGAESRVRNFGSALHPSPSPSPSSPLTPAERGGRSLRSAGRNPRCLGTNPRGGDAGDPERSALIHRVKQLAGRRLNGYEVVSTGLVHLVSGAEERWGTISIDRLRKIEALARGEEAKHGQ